MRKGEEDTIACTTMMIENINYLNCEITYTVCKVHDSYKVRSKAQMVGLINQIRSLSSWYKFTARSTKSYLREWKSHNLFYDLHLFRTHTKDVDLNSDEKRYRRLIYFMTSWLYFCKK